MRRGSVMRSVPWVLPLLVLGACSQPGPEGAAEQPRPDLPAAPWEGSRLSSEIIPEAYVTEWQEADNRATCALIAPRSPGIFGATPRPATFAGGWGVAYDLPEMRSAFGVAGAGVSVTGPTYSQWPYRIQWRDGSSVGYGPEGGMGPSLLAYLEIQGQDCLYNIWSQIGRAHLEQLIYELRFVEVEPEAEPPQ